MSSIRVTPISVNANGEEDYFGDETGTPDFYMVSDTLKKHLGEENIWVNWDYKDFIYVIEDRMKESNNTDKYIQIIETIYEPFAPFNFVYMKEHHLRFQIIKR